MGHEISGLATLLGSLPLFQGADNALLESLAATARVRSAEPKFRICSQGDVALSFFYVISGQVRRAVVSVEGSEKVIEVVTDGQPFGLAEVVAGRAYGSSATAVTAITLIEITGPGLRSALSASTSLARQVQLVLAEKYLKLQEDVAASHFHSGCRRLLNYLLLLAEKDLTEGDTVVVLPVTKGLLAEQLGMTAESLSRAFRDLSTAGLIEVHGRSITLLAKLAERRASARTDPSLSMNRNRRRTDQWSEAETALPLGSRGWL